MKLLKKHNTVLTEIFRRLNYFHHGDVDKGLLLLALPSEAKPLKEAGFITPSRNETPRTLNWYRLTNKGKALFLHHQTPVDDQTNGELYNGCVLDFSGVYVDDTETRWRFTDKALFLLWAKQVARENEDPEPSSYEEALKYTSTLPITVLNLLTQ